LFGEQADTSGILYILSLGNKNWWRYNSPECVIPRNQVGQCQYGSVTGNLLFPQRTLQFFPVIADNFIIIGAFCFNYERKQTYKELENNASKSQMFRSPLQCWTQWAKAFLGQAQSQIPKVSALVCSASEVHLNILKPRFVCWGKEKKKQNQTQNQKNTNKIGLVLDQSIQMHLKKLLKSSTVGQDHYKWHVSNQGTWSLTEEASSRFLFIRLYNFSLDKILFTDIELWLCDDGGVPLAFSYKWLFGVGLPSCCCCCCCCW